MFSGAALLGHRSAIQDDRVRVTLWRKWVYTPRSLFFRRLLFQVHLWIGIALGLYVVAISVSGSAIVCNRELSRIASRPMRMAAPAGRRRMPPGQIEQSIVRAYPGYRILSFREAEQLARPDLVILDNRRERIARLFDPYTGKDLGDPRPAVIRLLAWLADLHDNLLAGLAGRTFNGIGAFLLTVLWATGAVIWWPGIKNWRRSLRIQPKARFARLNWDLHSAVGFWCGIFVLIWGVSGFCLCFPGTLDSFFGIQLRLWLTRLHFGRFNGATEALWTVLGLAPGILAVTGALMWWQRVFRKRLHRIAGVLAGGRARRTVSVVR